ncbi:hypothetical protein NSQ59_14010 [Margalitia sp. FSL K6-0131]
MPQQKLTIVPVTLHAENEKPPKQIQQWFPPILLVRSRPVTLRFPSSMA